MRTENSLKRINELGVLFYGIVLVLRGEAAEFQKALLRDSLHVFPVRWELDFAFLNLFTSDGLLLIPRFVMLHSIQVSLALALLTGNIPA
ncbi:hypothetical protein BV898_11375 [Hypsibius exemplaris]|uniref:Uncharacterized protein n=1 Tax=Hypsibius exemplaris TaxID=2072580 RepID=A0A1W0WGR9_HYPEX|nr:hypothetical protein BV898_11375 [Hypsibius exemplaris]